MPQFANLTTLITGILAIVASGVSILPISMDGSKAPAIPSWKTFQSERPTESQIREWFSEPKGFAIIAGKISGNLEILDFDDPEAFPAWKQAVEVQRTELLESLPIVKTPSGGFHVYYRCETPPPGSKRLAQKDGENGKPEIKIETRGEGAYAIAPGSPPAVHPTGKPYKLIQGNLADIPTISSKDRLILIEAAKSLNEVFKPKKVVRAKSEESGDRPGDVYNRKATWEEILSPHGWEVVSETKGVTHWRRPGKSGPGTSATTNFEGSDVLYVFSTNAEPFEAEHGYSKFSAYALLNHSGDFSAAAFDLFEQGYGTLKSSDKTELYRETDSGIVWMKSGKDGKVPTPLTNFKAKIVSNIEEDDGAEVRHMFEIEAKLKGRGKRFLVSTTDFEKMNWVTRELGAEAVLHAGYGIKDRARAAIQLLSGDIPRRHIYKHTGWKDIEGEWYYLHAGGAIGSGGIPREDIVVDLSGSLSAFEFPSPPPEEEMSDLMEKYASLLKIAPPRVIYPLIGAAWRALFREVDFSIHLAGASGEGKTELAALAQQHYGSAFSPRNLPGSWSSTANAIEAQAYLAKDALFVLDDFAPSGTQNQINYYHQKADRVLRALGNNAGRQRMNADLTLRRERPPRCLILSTGEDVPKMQSVRARSLIVEVMKDDVSWDSLKATKKLAQKGIFAKVLAYCIHYIAPEYDEMRKACREIMEEKRGFFGTETGHKRTAGICADLTFGLEIALHFMHQFGAIDEDEHDELVDQATDVFLNLAASQEEHQEATEPTQLYLEYLAAAVIGGKAHVAARHKEHPENPQAWGWVRENAARRGHFDSWKPQGQLIGWLDGEDLYLDPKNAFAIVQKMGREMGESLNVTEATLRRRLFEKDLLISTEKENRLTVRRTLQAKRPRVLHLAASSLIEEVSSQSDDLEVA